MNNSKPLNRVIELFERENHAFATFSAPDPFQATQLSTSAYDAVIFEAEHKPWDVPKLRDSMQYLLDRRSIFEAETLSPSITPLVRIPPNGSERSQWHAKQALDLGAFGIIWPHITTVEEAQNAVAACRYPGASGGPGGLRGDSPAAAAKYWGLSTDEYYERSGVWGLDENGEILVTIMIEDLLGIENLDQILEQVPGIGLVLIGEGDLSQELGIPRQYEHPRMMELKSKVIETCRAHNTVVGHPHVTKNNVEQAISDGYGFLMSMPVTTYPGLELGRSLVSEKS